MPLELVTDRGTQFESKFFNDLAARLGFLHLRTTSYNPSCNGMVERKHRTLKKMLRANSKNWLLSLPLALLALRMIPSSATNTAPFTMVTGSALHLPANYLNHGLKSFTEKNVVSDLAQNVSSVQFAEPKWNRNQNIYVPRELQSCSKVWIRTDRVKKTS